ncbi:MAG: hypothetical protein KDK70_27770 [Myxococcales bacterium]|nr:hypothetical protein [Myxococcales bacterium]
MLGRLGDRLRTRSAEGRSVQRLLGTWKGTAEFLAVDLTGPQGPERVWVEHDGRDECKVAGPLEGTQLVTALLPARAMIRPAEPSEAALAFQVPTLGAPSSAAGLGSHAETLMGLEWASPRTYQAHAVRAIWAHWPHGLLLVRIEELHVDEESIGRIAWWPGSGAVVRTASLMASPAGVGEKLSAESSSRWLPEEAAWAQPDEALDALELPAWPEEGWLS